MSGTGNARASRLRRLAGAGVLLFAIALGFAARVHTTFRQPVFDAAGPELALKSDPALLYYVTRRIVESGGLPPADFRADPRVEHPLESDLPAMFTVGIEFLVAWAYLLFGGGASLLSVCVVATAAIASLTCVGVYGLALELTRSVRFASLAVLLYALSISSYRTIGFVLMSEDLSFPLFALHLWLLARAWRVRSAAACALAAAALAGALATWHAMTFVVSLEAACVAAWFLRTGQNPLAERRALVFPALLVVAGLAIPVLRAKLLLLSFPMQVTAALLVAAAVGRRSRGRLPAALVGVGALAACSALAFALTRMLAGELGDYGHVFELMWSKLRFGGALPDDPNRLSFGARLLWQGPFETGSISTLVARIGAPAVLMPVALLTSLPLWLRGRGDPRAALLAAFLAAALAVGILVMRLEALVGLLAPVATALLLRELPPRNSVAWIAGIVLVQGATFGQRLSGYTIEGWYPERYQAELREVVDWIRTELPPEGAVATDFVNSASVLAYTGHPVMLQPKYETRRSRDRIEAFCAKLYHASPEELARWLRDEIDARYLLVDIALLWDWRYQCGIPYSVETPPAGSAAAALMDPNRRALLELADFRLLYTNGPPPHSWRLFELREPIDPAHASGP